MTNTFSLILPIIIPVIAGLMQALVPAFGTERGRKALVLCSLALTFVVTLWQAFQTGATLQLFSITADMPVKFAVDGVTSMFSVLIALMWLMSGIFSFEYMKHEEDHKRYYGFFIAAEGAMLGVAFAANYLTMYLCFEWMTVLTLPLVFHSKTTEAISAGMMYLLYSMAGAFAGLIGIPFMMHFGRTLDFVPGGVLDMSVVSGHEGLVLAVAFIVIVGFGAKAGLFPLHDWLPTAHPVAPAPASAVLSGVITKAGVITIIRVIYYQFGMDFLKGTWVQYVLLCLALLTVFMGSSMAFGEDVLKKRLAYSTVSQVSYVLFGLFLMNATAMSGALLHVLAHSIAKDGLFLCAGAIIYKTHRTNVSELGPIGKQMPVTMWCFTLYSLALIGIPPMCGFLSKWYLGLGSLSSGIPVINWLGPVILLISAILTAAYLLPIILRGFFPGVDYYDYKNIHVHCEPNAWMTVPLIILGVLAAFTIFPQPFMALISSIVSPLM